MFKKNEAKFKPVPEKAKRLVERLLVSEPDECHAIIAQLMNDDDYDTLNHLATILEKNIADNQSSSETDSNVILQNRIHDIYDDIDKKVVIEQIKRSGLRQSCCTLI